MKRLLLLLVCVLFINLISVGQTTIFSENMGTPSVTTAISANVFQNSAPITFSGTADVRNTSVSSGYTGASGGGNIFFTNSGGTPRTFLISGINTSAYSSIVLTFGMLTVTSATALTVECSSDGTLFSALSISNSSNTSWTLKTATGVIPTTSNLRLRFTSNGTNQFRIDDVKLTGVIAVADPTSISATPTSPSQINVAFTQNANSNNVLIAYNTTNSFGTPEAGTTYGAGNNLGTATVAYYGSGAATPFHHTGLTANTQYYYKLWSYDGVNYSPGTTPVNATTYLEAPTTQASNLTFPAIGSTSMTTSWTNGNGAKRVVIVNTVNSFTAPANGTDPTANTAYAGSGEQVVYNGTGNSVGVSGLAVSTTYWFRVYEYNNTGAYTQYNVSTNTNNPNSQITVSGSTAPFVSLPTVSEITSTTAVLGGTITGDGGSPILERGTVWKLSPGVTISDNLLAEGNTSVSAFSHVRSLPAGTLIYFKAYATNAIGSSLSSESSFYTLATEPTSHATSFSASPVSYNSINLTWTPATGANGYLILMKSGASAPTGLPVDATGYTVGNTIGDGTLVADVLSGSATSQNIGSLTPSTQYSFTIIPYAYDGVNYQTYNYKTDGTVPSATATTPGAVYTWIGADNGDWTVSTNWSPTRTTPVNTDVLQFNDGTIKTITNVPTQTVAQIFVTNNTSVTLKTASTPKVLTINGATGNDFIVSAGSAFNVSGDVVISVTLGTGATGLIDGSVTLSGTAAAAAHRLIATSAGSLVFANGSTFTAGSFFSGNAFGAANLNSVVFQSGSVYVLQAGSNPFGASSPNSVVTFQPGSLYRHESTGTPSFSGRTFADFELNSADADITGSGGSACVMNNLTVTAGSLNLTLTNVSIKGDVTVNDGATLRFNGTGIYTFSGTSPQTISGDGTFSSSGPVYQVNNDLTLGKSATLNGCTVALNKNLTILEGAVMTINPAKTLVSSGTITLNGVDALVLAADATGQAGYMEYGTLTYNPGATAKVQRYVPAGSVAYVSSPVSDATRMVFTGTVNNKLYQYNANAPDNTTAWELIPIDATPLEIMRGYVVKYAANTTLNFSGHLNTGNIDAGTAGTISLFNGATFGYNLVGNPYASTINIGSVANPVFGWTLGTDIQRKIAYRKSDGNVAYWDMAGSGLGNNGGTSYIPATEAYWINLDGTTDMGFGVANSVRVANVQNIYKLVETPRSIFRMTADFNGHTDETTIGFLPDAANTFDVYDMDKMMIEDPAFAMVYTKLGDHDLAINGNAPIEGNQDVVLGFKCLTAGDFTFTANFSEFDGNTAVSLEDTQLGITQDLRENPEYSFTSPAIQTSTRFILHFGTPHVEGTITYANSVNTPLAHATVNLLNENNEVIATTETDAQGAYTFSKTINGPMHLEVVSTTQTGGWNSIDALLVMSHFVGLQSLDGLYLAAADVNHDGAVNAIDGMLIQQRFVQAINSFPASQFVTETKEVVVTSPGETLHLNVKALHRGDVNGSFVPEQ